MKDLKKYSEKLKADAEDCLTISRMATDEEKRKVFATMAETYRNLAEDLDRIIAAHQSLDEQRESHLFGILGDESGGQERDSPS